MYLRFKIVAFLFCSFVISVNSVFAALPVPGGVSSFKLTSYEITDGKSLYIKWKKPSGFSDDVYYNIYLQQPGSSYLWAWRAKYSPSVIDKDGYYQTSREFSGLGSHNIHIEACNTENKCGTRLTKTVKVTLAVPGAVTSFSLSQSGITDGESIDIKWKKPSGFSGDVYYNIYLQQPGSSYLWPWRTNYSPTATNGIYQTSRGFSGLGTHRVHIEACNAEKKCGTRLTRTVTVSLAVPGSVSSFYLSDSEIINGTGTDINWKKPGGFSDDVYYNIYLQQPGSSYLWPWRTKYFPEAVAGAYKAERVFTGIGTHSVHIEACNMDDKCGGKLSRTLAVIEKPLTIPEFSFLSIPESAVISHSEKGVFQISWQEVAGAKYYLLHEESVPYFNKDAKVKVFEPGNVLSMEINKVSGDYLYKIKACNDDACTAYSETKAITVGAGKIQHAAHFSESNLDDILGDTLVNPVIDTLHGGTLDFSEATSFVAESRTNKGCDVGKSECSKAMVFKGSQAERNEDRVFEFNFDMQLLNYDWSYEAAEHEGKGLWWILFQDWFRVNGYGTANSPVSSLEIARNGDELYLLQYQRAYLWDTDIVNNCTDETCEKLVGEYKIADSGQTTSDILSIKIRFTEASVLENNIEVNAGMDVWVNGELISVNTDEAGNLYSRYKIKSFDGGDKSTHRTHSYGFGIYHSWGSWNTEYSDADGENLKVALNNLTLSGLDEGEYTPSGSPVPPKVTVAGKNITLKLDRGAKVNDVYGYVSGMTHFYSQVQYNNGDWQEERKHEQLESVIENQPAGEYKFRLKFCNGNLCSDYSESAESAPVVIE